MRLTNSFLASAHQISQMWEKIIIHVCIFPVYFRCTCFFYKRPPNMGKMAFLDVFGGFRAVTSPDFIYIRAVRIFLRALVGVYQFPKKS